MSLLPPLARHRQAEVMDGPDLDPKLHHAALAGLERINRWSLNARAFWGPIEELARERESPLRVLDVASGGGDLVRALVRRARRASLGLEVSGCDLSERAVARATDRAQEEGLPATFTSLDALEDELPTDRDVLTSSLFLHHLDEDDACRLLARMATAARSLVIVCDLERSRRGLGLAHVATRLLTRSHVVHTDGVRSVAQAFTRAEAVELARRAGLDGARVERVWPLRWRLVWRREA